MKRISTYLYITAVLFAGISCTQDKPEEEAGIRLEGIVAQLGEKETGSPEARAISDFAVNTSADPTHESTRLTGGGDWTLSVNILDRNNADYPPGNALCTYSGSAWIPETELFFPSYRSPHVLASLYPPGWNPETSQIAQNQSDAATLLSQDILVQNGSPYTVRPSHTPTIVLRHAHSMLNFILSDVNSAQITSVDVLAGGLVYQPYPVAGRSQPEYMVILPVGTTNPVVRVTTSGGARYQETINIGQASGTGINTCYCVKLLGVELILSSVTIIDWIYGTALEGSYTTVTSYPTFRGIPNTTITLYFDNGLQQEITFNDEGESTVKPVGRIITQIDDYVMLVLFVLDRMYVDLRPYLQQDNG